MEANYKVAMVLDLAIELNGKALSQDALREYIGEIESIVKQRLQQERFCSPAETSIVFETKSSAQNNQISAYALMKFGSEANKQKAMEQVPFFARPGDNLNQDNLSIEVYFEMHGILSPQTARIHFPKDFPTEDSEGA